MTTSRSVRGLAALAAGALLWGLSAGPAAADSNRDAQWVLKNYGMAERVWPISQGDGVIVAVIDGGVDPNHPDLVGQVLPGADFSGGNTDGRVPDGAHGTAMASDIAAHGHGDNAGVMGLAPKAKILPVKIALGKTTIEGKVLDGSLVGKAIRYSVDHGAKVINMSFVGGSSVDDGYRTAVEYAIQKDVVLVAGAGNFGNNLIEYPAAFPGVVVASGITETGDMWPKSNTGPQVTLAAPAENIRNADLNNMYGTGSGTSDSAAFVSGIAALVRAKYPNLSAGQVINRMIKSAVQPKDKGTFPNDNYGYGIVSAAGSLAANPAVDNGPKENPLLNRPEPNGVTAPSAAADPAKTPAAGGANSPQASSDSGSSSGMLVAVGGGILGVLVVVLIVVLVRRSKKGGNGGGPGGPAGGPGAPGGYGQQPPPGYGQPQQQPPAGYPQQQYPPQGQYPPPQPPAGGNPYQR
ncbi:S8 family serine peptidase [Kitasatospora sp. NPDC088134]|uniref:S8 family serine peptidase n=1 Tax=Kitasatospora sp. NPDC088134 TaxID=3364071 RepID=UPI0037FD3A59